MLRFLVVGLLALSCYGCSAGNGPSVVPVSGTVTYKNKAVPNANVTFAPEGGGRIASGRTNAAGQFTLGTFSTNDGAIVGKHRVSIQATGPERDPKPGEGSGMPGDKMPGDPTIPTKYFAPDTSGLTHEVKPGSTRVDLDLKD